MTENTSWAVGVPDTLRQAVRGGRCVPFVGPLLSATSGYPTWTRLIEVLATRCEQELRPNTELIRALAAEGDFLDAAERARHKLGGAVYSRVLQDAFTNPGLKPTEAHRLVWALASPLIITTNWDDLLERGAAEEGVVVNVVTPLDRSRQASLLQSPVAGERTLFKLHGSVGIPESLVFTRSDYDSLTDDISGITWTLLSLLVERTILFLGFSTEDPASLAALDRSAQLFNGWSGANFALLPAGDHATREWWSRFGVQVVEYDRAEGPASLLAALEDALPDADTSSRRHGRTGRRRSTRSHVIDLAPGPAVPSMLQPYAFGECVVATVARMSDDRLTGWRDDGVSFEIDPVFLKVDEPLLEVQEAMEARFRQLDQFPNFRYHLRSFGSTKGRLTIRAGLTDWALVHGVQQCLIDPSNVLRPEVEFLFWQSVERVVTGKGARPFPHHIATHGIVVTSDRKLVVCKRMNVSNQMGRLSVSFEEQVQPPGMIPNNSPRGPLWRRVDGDRSPLEAAARGAREELDLSLTYADDVVVLGIGMEAASIAANVFVLVKVPETIEQVYRSWRGASDRYENLMVPPPLAPTWEPGSVAELIAGDEGFADDDTYRGQWHASSKIRILLSLLYDFGAEAVREYVDPADLDRLFAARRR